MVTQLLRWTAASVMAVGWLLSQEAFGCGPFFAQAIFTYALHPDLPLTTFAQGQLGILQPTYARSYLYVAYRYLIGMGLDATEQQTVLALWDERLNPPADWNPWNPTESDALKAWYDARAKVVPGEPHPSIKVFKTLEARNGHYFLTMYLNCPEDAFLTAVRTLNDRIAQFGAESPEVKDWVRAQDRVFQNCSGAKAVPDPSTPGSPPIVQADRAYQIAAAHFYAGDFDVAEHMFRDISNDPTSPWRQLAPYLMARTLVRQGTLVPAYDKLEKEPLLQAATQLQQVLRDNNLQVIHPAAQRLLTMVRFRLDPEPRLHELAQRLLQQHAGDTLKQDLWDYTMLLDQFAGEHVDDGPSAARREDVTDWILTFQARGQDALEYALNKWRETAAAPWLVASLAQMPAGHPKLQELLEAAANVPSNAPAFTSVMFHRLRLMAQSGKRGEARQSLDDTLSQGKAAFPPASRNLLLALRLKLAHTLDEFLQYAPRVPVAITYGGEGQELPVNLETGEGLKVFAGDRPLFDGDSARILNQRLPLSALKEAVSSDILPGHLRRELAIAVWVRAFLLGDEMTARHLVPTVKRLAPELQPSLDEYLAAANPEARKFAGLFMILRFPGLKPHVEENVGRSTPLDQIDNYRNNWWCSAEAGTQHSPRSADKPSTPLEMLYADAPDNALPFLREAQSAAAHQEWAQLAALGTAPNYLSQQVMTWGQRRGSDARLPEALHLAVKSTRYGCTDDDTGKFSKAAFEWLHKRYPKSAWAQKTPYWYK